MIVLIIYLLIFPDPWPKKRHEKHRLVTPEFMKEISRIVIEGGEAFLVTDDNDAQKWMLQAALSSNKWETLYKTPYFISHIEGYGGSYFDSLWREKGKKIKYMQFTNKK